MKPLFAITTILFVLIGCRKADIHIIRGKLVKCDVAEHGPVVVGYAVGCGFKKSYYSDGLVKTVLTKLNFIFYGYDSMLYTFTYSHNKANVTANRWSYTIQGAGEDGYIIIPDPDRPPVQYSFIVEFDPKTFNAIKAGNTTFKYDKYGKLLAYDDFAIEYDDKGNIVVVNREYGGSVRFKYNYTTTAKQQQYYTTGYMTNEMYNLMEIMNWIPVEPNNLRTAHTIYPETDLFMGEFYFLDHKVNSDGRLTAYEESYSEYPTEPKYPRLNISWNCQPVIAPRGNNK